MRYVGNSMWRVFCSCFLQGAWRCLNQNMSLETRHSFSVPSSVVCLPSTELGRKRKENMLRLICIFGCLCTSVVFAWGSNELPRHQSKEKFPDAGYSIDSYSIPIVCKEGKLSIGGVDLGGVYERFSMLRALRLRNAYGCLGGVVMTPTESKDPNSGKYIVGKVSLVAKFDIPVYVERDGMMCANSVQKSDVVKAEITKIVAAFEKLHGLHFVNRINRGVSIEYAALLNRQNLPDVKLVIEAPAELHAGRYDIAVSIDAMEYFERHFKRAEVSCWNAKLKEVLEEQLTIAKKLKNNGRDFDHSKRPEFSDRQREQDPDYCKSVENTYLLEEKQILEDMKRALKMQEVKDLAEAKEKTRMMELAKKSSDLKQLWMGGWHIGDEYYEDCDNGKIQPIRHFTKYRVFNGKLDGKSVITSIHLYANLTSEGDLNYPAINQEIRSLMRLYGQKYGLIFKEQYACGLLKYTKEQVTEFDQKKSGIDYAITCEAKLDEEKLPGVRLRIFSSINHPLMSRLGERHDIILELDATDYINMLEVKRVSEKAKQDVLTDEADADRL